MTARFETTVPYADGQAIFTFTERDQPRWVSPKYDYYTDGEGRRRSIKRPGYYTCTMTDFTKKPRIYVDVAGESLLDNLANRTSRPVNVWGKALRAAIKSAGYSGRVNWYQRAGCSCPCSPGFIWTNAPKVDFTGLEGTWGARNPHTRYDVWVQLGDLPKARRDPSAQMLQAARRVMIQMDPTLPDLSKYAV